VVEMIKLLCGTKGSGKTKRLIDMANSEMKSGNGNIAFVDVDDNHIFSLDYSVRLINAMEFNINNIESFYGFLCGIIGMNYDVEKIYVDGIYNLIDIKIENLESLVKSLETISKKFNTDFYIGLDYTVEEIPTSLKSIVEEVTEE
jgi:myosin-crossreactive antigen